MNKLLIGCTLFLAGVICICTWMVVITIMHPQFGDATIIFWPGAIMILASLFLFGSAVDVKRRKAL
ncbi:hypothetical protein KQ51_01588 [Candidatus Izimaplasma bacterium HR1]|jgi:hypothetical protein|uniref:hypothetical protein n=1 Tax=Candidatus Izimoplasma sp. HR1 TaxID=1541959 RepID=UPI0004F61757|nr:hypothetical protein KQ51_01588 [Candidatus Izimaplasma bacterium HR1]